MMYRLLKLRPQAALWLGMGKAEKMIFLLENQGSADAKHCAG
jgi:hypothetical protein